MEIYLHDRTFESMQSSACIKIWTLKGSSKTFRCKFLNI